MTDIKRQAGTARGRSRVVEHAGLVYTVATAGAPGRSVAEQTRLSLAGLDGSLADGGSDRTRILSATVYLADIADKAEMDAVWCEWIGPPESWPQRACVQAGLEGETKVEIVLVAARTDRAEGS